MFNFFRSKGRAAKFLLSGVLGLVALSLLLYLVPNYYGDPQNAINPVLLEAGGRKVTFQQATSEYQAFARERIPPQMMGVYFPQWFDETYKLRFAGLEAARQIGIATTDDEVRTFMAANPPLSQFFENGILVRRQELETALAQSGLTIDRLFDDVRDQITISKLEDAIAGSTVVTPQEVEDAYKRKYDKISVEYFAFSEGELKNQVTVTDEEIQTRYEATKALHRQPERFSYRVVVLTKDKVAESVNVTEQELRAEYNAAIDNFRIPETVRARHILLSTSGKSDDEKKALLTRAQDLVKQLKAGADFAELAKKNSDDSNAETGGDLGTFGRGAMEKPFEDAAFALQPNGISDAVETRYGYHIIQVTEKTPSRITPFEAVRAQLEQEYKASKLDDTMHNASSQLQVELARTPADAAAIAQKFGAQLITVVDAAQGDAIPTLGVSPEIESALSDAKEGSATSAVALPGERAAVAILDKKTPSRDSTFEEARGDIRSQLIDEAARNLLNQRSKDAADRLRNGEDIQAVAKSLNMKVGTASNFTLSENLPDLGPASPLQEAFRKPVGAIVAPVVMQGRTVVAKVTSKTPADMTDFASEKQSLQDSLKAQRRQQNTSLWLEGVTNRLIADGDIKIFNDEIQRIATSYR